MIQWQVPRGRGLLNHLQAASWLAEAKSSQWYLHLSDYEVVALVRLDQDSQYPDDLPLVKAVAQQRSNCSIKKQELHPQHTLVPVGLGPGNQNRMF